jgi:hypothetical protein
MAKEIDSFEISTQSYTKPEIREVFKQQKPSNSRFGNSYDEALWGVAKKMITQAIKNGDNGFSQIDPQVKMWSDVKRGLATDGQFPSDSDKDESYFVEKIGLEHKEKSVRVWAVYNASNLPVRFE